MCAWMLINGIEMLFKSIYKLDLIDKFTKIINVSYIKSSDLLCESPQWKRTKNNHYDYYYKNIKKGVLYG
jgi:hypothetical protein